MTALVRVHAGRVVMACVNSDYLPSLSTILLPTSVPVTTLQYVSRQRTRRTGSNNCLTLPHRPPLFWRLRVMRAPLSRGGGTWVLTRFLDFPSSMLLPPT